MYVFWENRLFMLLRDKRLPRLIVHYCIAEKHFCLQVFSTTRSTPPSLSAPLFGAGDDRPKTSGRGQPVHAGWTTLRETSWPHYEELADLHPIFQLVLVQISLFFISSWCKIASAARNWRNSAPKRQRRPLASLLLWPLYTCTGSEIVGGLFSRLMTIFLRWWILWKSPNRCMIRWWILFLASFRRHNGFVSK